MPNPKNESVANELAAWKDNYRFSPGMAPHHEQRLADIIAKIRLLEQPECDHTTPDPDRKCGPTRKCPTKIEPKVRDLDTAERIIDALVDVVSEQQFTVASRGWRRYDSDPSGETDWAVGGARKGQWTNIEEVLRWANEYRELVTLPPSVVDAINTLRHGEGSSLMFLCQNPDGHGPDNETIVVSTEWTNWEDRRFTGATLAECLAQALAAMPDHCKPTKGGTFISLDGPLPDFIQGPPISRVCAPPVEAANLSPHGGRTGVHTRDGDVTNVVAFDHTGRTRLAIAIATATPQEIMSVYAHLKYEVEQACINFRRFGGIAAKAYAELGGDQGRDARSLMRSLNTPLVPSATTGCAHPRATEVVIAGVGVGKFACPDCALTFPSPEPR